MMLPSDSGPSTNAFARKKSLHTALCVEKAYAALSGVKTVASLSQQAATALSRSLRDRICVQASLTVHNLFAFCVDAFSAGNIPRALVVVTWNVAG